MLERDVKTFLLEDSDVRDYCTGGIYPAKAPRKTRGRVIILRPIFSERSYSLSNEIALADYTLQIDCYAESPYHAERLFQLVRNRISGYRGNVGDSSIQGTRIISERMLAEEPEDASDKWVHRYSADFSLFYPQTVPTHV